MPLGSRRCRWGVGRSPCRRRCRLGRAAVHGRGQGGFSCLIVWRQIIRARRVPAEGCRTPVLGFAVIDELAQADSAVATCADASVWALSEHDLIAALDATHRLQQRLAAVQLARVRELDGRGTAVAQGASSTAVWLRHRLRLDVSAARRLVGLAASLDVAPSAVRDALASGAVSVEQARVIADTAATVSARAGAEVADKAVGVLVDWAGQFDPALLRKLGTRILDHVAPDLADAAAAAALAAEAARATRDRHVTISEQADGRLRLSGTLDAEAAALLRAVIDPLSAPSGPDDTRCAGQRRHDALADVCRLALRTSELPENRRRPRPARRHHRLRRAGAAVGCRHPRRRPAAHPRHCAPPRLRRSHPARRARRHRAGPRRRPTRRLVTGPLRRALVLRDRGCAFPGCDRPPRWCAAHHIRHWADGGPTSLDNAVLLCGHHHRTSTTPSGWSGSATTATPSSCRRPGSTPTSSRAATTTTDGRRPIGCHRRTRPLGYHRRTWGSVTTMNAGDRLQLTDPTVGIHEAAKRLGVWGGPSAVCRSTTMPSAQCVPMWILSY